MRRRPLVAVIVIGLGLAAAPAIFQMFDRAPKGGDMINEFRPYMTPAKIGSFRDYLADVGAADAEARRELPDAGQQFPAVAELHRRWPAIDDDMSDMLTTMQRNLGNFRGVDALPPFPLFPWFFVIPGVMAAALGWRALRSGRGRRALVVLGVGLVLAPGVFQMFTRAPGGARMIDEFRPLMTTSKVTTVQGYFLVLGAAEGQLRTEALTGDTASSLPDVEQLTRVWPRMSNEMAPMIGTMADNRDNFAAVDALPPFWLFPWFFVLPGLLIAGLALAADRPLRSRAGPASTERTVRRAVGSPTAVLLLAALALVGCGGDDDEQTAAGDELTGLFRIAAGACEGDDVTGSYFRMVQPGGTVQDGPFVVNGDSPCPDKNVTPLSPGRDGGLRTGTYQPQPDEPFDRSGNAVSQQITRPQRWFAVAFGLSTNERDPQTDRAAPEPRVAVDGDEITGDLSALAASWNGQHFNQGAPKPGGDRPGNTAGPRGTYDNDGRTYTLEWSSQIVGGPFDNFTGIWHLEGTFEPS